MEILACVKNLNVLNLLRTQCYISNWQNSYIIWPHEDKSDRSCKSLTREKKTKMFVYMLKIFNQKVADCCFSCAWFLKTAYTCSQRQKFHKVIKQEWDITAVTADYEWVTCRVDVSVWGDLEQPWLCWLEGLWGRVLPACYKLLDPLEWTEGVWPKMCHSTSPPFPDMTIQKYN